MTTAIAQWRAVCALEALPVGRGVAALVDGVQVAIFRVPDVAEVFALANVDPSTGVGCLSRGILGDAGGELMVVSPLHKHRYSLRTGVCLDDDELQVAVFEAREREGVVEVRVP
jgi:nitrite reductase (NADH) small subunit